MNFGIKALAVLLITKTCQFITVIYYSVKHTNKEDYKYLKTDTMKTQQVGVDFWAMGKSMLTYGALTALCWIMLRLINAVFTLPRRMRQQQQTIQESLQELQRRFPDLNITEEDLLNAEKEFDELVKDENETKENEIDHKDENEKESVEETAKVIEDKKTL